MQKREGAAASSARLGTVLRPKSGGCQQIWLLVKQLVWTSFWIRHENPCAMVPCQIDCLYCEVGLIGLI
jgi:hypothetical protein